MDSRTDLPRPYKEKEHFGYYHPYLQQHHRPTLIRFKCSPKCLFFVHYFYFCFVFIIIMAPVARVSSTSPLLSLIFPSTCSLLPLQTKALPTHSKIPCCFSSQSSILSTTQKRFTTLCAKPFVQSRQEPSARIRRPPQQNKPHSTNTNLKGPKLEIPEVIFSNNHLVVVNKPAGWKSQPGDGGGGGSNNDGRYSDPKCLLTYLKSQSLGGGSQKDFISPTHRLDQPCTGVLIFAKNGKAASRVQVAWSKQKVQKCYWVVVEGGMSGSAKLDGLELLRSRSVRLSGNGDKGQKTNTHRLSAILKSSAGSKGRNARGRGGRSNNNAGGSVTVKPLPRNLSSSDDGSADGRVCHIEWEHLLSLRAKAPSSSTRHLLSVTTDTGAKHQVRALLALAGGTPIAGDLRYGNSNQRHKSQYSDESSRYREGVVDRPLPDASVALHARKVFLPTVSLGGMDFLKDDPFLANLPNSWRDFFGICEDDVKGLL